MRKTAAWLCCPILRITWQERAPYTASCQAGGGLFPENHGEMGATIHGVACSACKTHGCDFALEGALSLDGGDTYGYVSQELPPEDFEGPGQRGAGGFGRPHAEKEPVSPDHSPRRGKQPSAGNNPV